MTRPLKTGVDRNADQADQFEAFVRLTHGRLLARAKSRLGSDYTLAEDMVQDAYLRLWRVWPRQHEVILAVITYSYRTLDNCIREFWRVKNNWPLSRDEERSESADVVEENAFVEGWEVHDALSRLPARMREVITLSVYDGLGMAEVAERMGIAVGTARNYKTSGMQMLRETFRQLPTE